ncbi:ABC transporter ATP-binding protein [uncultured Planktomarina sp.]|jgi:ABC-type branched-subunit amino acid transport system ATPase component|uniref:ABC transporter ATP-binding protein n=1 Tax=uncultured Planktomarina sp. TaxID=1538529 RepID=UPI00326193ED|tara:strand:+ start:966 stop:1712 length:747 start_codon:yes stop_codon:yes gene_type:complete
MTEPLLKVEKLCAGYGSGDIVKNAGFTVSENGISTIVGPNGAGKSTLIKALVGLLIPRSGSIILAGKDVGKMNAPAKARAGLGYVPQEHNVFRNLSIGENMMLAYEFIAPDRAGFSAARDRVFDIFPDLVGRESDLAGNLSGGQRQMLAFGCALMPHPSLLLLDEPSAGLSPKYVEGMFAAVKAVNDAGVCILMIEQNVREAMAISETAIVLAAGEIRAQMPAREFMNHPDIHALYMGAASTRQQEGA